MDIKGLDYNTQREKLVMPEYGREVQSMVDYCVKLADKAERQACAETIITIMERMFPQGRESTNYRQKLWDQLAYPMQRIAVRHYGHIIFELFEKLKVMEPGPERDALVRLTANQMKVDLMAWSHGSNDNEKVAADLARYTDGKIQLDLDSFVFNKIVERPVANTVNKRKKR